MSATTEVELYQDRNPEAFAVSAIADGIRPHDIVDGWVGMLVQVDTLANAICDTAFVPKELKGKPAAIAACFLTGRELGIGPMASLKHIQIVEGTPSLSAEYKRARVLERGHEYRIVELTKLKCIIEGRRRGQREWTRFEYTITDARTARLVKSRGSWETRPKRMLLARASSDMCDAMFTDCVNGMATAELIAEELDPDQSPDLTPPAGADGDEKKTVRRRRKPRAVAPEPEIDEQPEQPEQPEPAGEDPELAEENWDDPAEEDWFDDEDEEPAVSEEPVSGEAMITAGQLTRLQAQAKNLRLSDEQRHRAASEITGRVIASFKALAEDEADEVIDIFAVAQRKDNPQAALKRLVASAVRDREEGIDDLDGDD